MTDLDLSALLATARAAKEEAESGAWVVGERWMAHTIVSGRGEITSRDDSPRALVQANSNFPSRAVLAHIAAVCPDVVIALVERLQRAEMELHVAHVELRSLRASIDRLIRESEERYQAHRDAQAMLDEVAAERDMRADQVRELMRVGKLNLASLMRRKQVLTDAVDLIAEERDRLAVQIANYEANHGARCDAEQERYATIAESACRMLADVRARLEAADGVDDTALFLIRNDIGTFLSLPSHEVPGLRAKVAEREAALDACAARIADLLQQASKLEARRDELLALVANISQSTPLPSEVDDWEGQRARLIAEVGTLRAHVADLVRDRDERLAAAQRGTQHSEKQARDLTELMVELERQRDAALAASLAHGKTAGAAAANDRRITGALIEHVSLIGAVANGMPARSNDRRILEDIAAQLRALVAGDAAPQGGS